MLAPALSTVRGAMGPFSALVSPAAWQDVAAWHSDGCNVLMKWTEARSNRDQTTLLFTSCLPIVQPSVKPSECGLLLKLVRPKGFEPLTF